MVDIKELGVSLEDLGFRVLMHRDIPIGKPVVGSDFGSEDTRPTITLHPIDYYWYIFRDNPEAAEEAAHNWTHRNLERQIIESNQRLHDMHNPYGQDRLQANLYNLKKSAKNVSQALVALSMRMKVDSV